MVYQCVGCGTSYFQPLGGFKPNPSTNDPNRVKAILPHSPPVSSNCEHCGSRFTVCILFDYQWKYFSNS